LSTWNRSRSGVPVLLGSSRSEEEDGGGEKGIDVGVKWSEAGRISSGWGW